jgi:pantothenate kinase
MDKNTLKTYVLKELKRITDTYKPPVVVGLSGPPAVGKSTISTFILKKLPGSAIVPIDSFHISNKLIMHKGTPHGSPSAFDIDGCINAIERILAGKGIYIPLYNRKLKEPIAASNFIPANRELIILEGVFVGYPHGKWTLLNKMIDELWFMQLPKSELYKRLIRRESRYLDRFEAIEKVKTIDLHHYNLALKKIRPYANKTFFY